VSKLFAAAIVAAAALLVVSCIGSRAGITIRADGSGSLALEYRIAKSLEELGKLDGNERWLPVPAGRADLERSVRRVKGLKLASYSQKEDGDDLVISARLDFASQKALNSFLDASGQKAGLDMEKRRFVCTFEAAPPEAAAPELRKMAAASLAGYEFSLSVTLPVSAPRLRWLDGGGTETAGPGASGVTGSTVTFSAPMEELVFLEKTLVMEISW
jgi:hypothetical protein